MQVKDRKPGTVKKADVHPKSGKQSRQEEGILFKVLAVSNLEALEFAKSIPCFIVPDDLQPDDAQQADEDNQQVDPQLAAATQDEQRLPLRVKKMEGLT